MNYKKLIFNHKSLTINRGFTLIEMLVVISLIGILAALAIVSFGNSQKQARDTVRKSDLRQYQNALEAYANLANGLYPSRTSPVTAATSLCGDLNTKLEPDISCSEDPKNASDATFIYKYLSDGTGGGTTTGTKYVVWGKIENVSATSYWVACSNGKVGVSTSAPTTGSCPI